MLIGGPEAKHLEESLVTWIDWAQIFFIVLIMSTSRNEYPPSTYSQDFFILVLRLKAKIKLWCMCRSLGSGRTCIIVCRCMSGSCVLYLFLFVPLTYVMWTQRWKYSLRDSSLRALGEHIFQFVFPEHLHCLAWQSLPFIGFTCRWRFVDFVLTSRGVFFSWKHVHFYIVRYVLASLKFNVSLE